MSECFGTCSDTLSEQLSTVISGSGVPKVPPGSSPTMQAWTVGICFPLMVQLGRLLTPGHYVGPHLDRWVHWSKFLAQGNNSNTKVTTREIEPGPFQLPGQCPSHLAILSHSHYTLSTHTTHTRTRTLSFHVSSPVLFQPITPHKTRPPTWPWMLSNQLEALNFDQLGHATGGGPRLSTLNACCECIA